MIQMPSDSTDAYAYKSHLSYKPSGAAWLGDIPTHWEVIRLKYLAWLELSNVDKHTVEGQRSVLLCNYVDVYKNGRITSAFDFMRASATDEQIRRLSIRKSDVLFTKDSETPNDIGIPAIVVEELSGVVCGYHLALARPVADSILGEFLFRAIQSSTTKAYYFVESVGMTRYGLGKQSLAATPIPVPPLDEQRAIAAFLDRETGKIDTLIAKKERLIKLLQEKRRAVISHAVTKGLNPNAPMKDSGVEWLGRVPAHWQVKRLKYVGIATTGLTYDPSQVTTKDRGILVLRASNVQDDRIVLEDNVYVDAEIPHELVTRTGDILLCSRSGSRALIGKNARITPEVAGASFGAFMTVFRSQYNNYLSYVFNSAIFNFQAGAFQTSTINQLTLGALNGFQVPLPPLKEQTQIVDHLTTHTAAIDTLITRCRRSIDLMHEYRTSLITTAVTGKIDVRKEVAN